MFIECPLCASYYAQKELFIHSSNTLQPRCYYPQFTSEEYEAWRGEQTFPRLTQLGRSGRAGIGIQFLLLLVQWPFFYSILQMPGYGRLNNGPQRWKSMETANILPHMAEGQVKDLEMGRLFWIFWVGSVITGVLIRGKRDPSEQY